MAFVVCSINLNLVMESGTRKGRKASNRALRTPWPLFVYGGVKMGKKQNQAEGITCKDDIYRDEEGQEISTYTEDVDCIARVKLEPLRDFLNMTFDDNEAQKMAFIAGALLERAEGKIYEATKYIEKNYGTVNLVRATYNQEADIDPETILGVVFTPSKAEVTA